MASDLIVLQRCKKIIEENLDWGAGETWQTLDFENLSQLILDKTGVSLSISTLRRIWGRVEYNHLPSTTTLNTLAKFAGYHDWRTFAKEQRPAPLPEPETIAPVRTVSQPFALRNLIWPALVLLAVTAFCIVAFQRSQMVSKDQYAFRSHRVTRGVPNSVIFTYDASASPTDSVFIQQSWDSSTRTRVDKNTTKHTSIYYEPGVYTAKLIVGDQVVKEHQLVIPTNGWVATIGSDKVPVYLKDREFMHDSLLRIPVEVIRKNNIALQPQPPFARIFNVGNFPPVPLDDFSFSVSLKNEFGEGAGVCQYSFVSLLTDDIPIFFPLSIEGCVSELNIRCVDSFASGKKTDLSAFGVDYAKWVHISCKGDGKKIRYYVNDRLAIEFPAPQRHIRVLGLAFGFQGTGAVKDIALNAGNKTVFQAF
ncbi:hypothetical protein [Dyadobacter luticola]|uniref:PKD domain-containing protein n=1 Tax=Dyadobacter luticola TaxID=1979387 RepID=A0A5R9L2J3_9BACT|nr:hypothetical protein [Dyadobacter luticola]TLV02569.1 hypothetical protein FEN17_02815 [Dyadobacter luticola]